MSVFRQGAQALIAAALGTLGAVSGLWAAEPAGPVKAPGGQYDYGKVCGFVTEVIDSVERRASSDEIRKEMRTTKTAVRHRYAADGIEAEIVVSNGDMIADNVHLTGSAVPKTLQTVDDVQAYFMTGALKGEAVELECDAVTMRIDFSGQGIREISLSSSFAE